MNAWNVDFVVSASPLVMARRPIVGVDGPVQGADVCYDHHVTGEPVNMDAIPLTLPFPGTLATTMLDNDAIISAAVVLLRASGEERILRSVWAPLYEAAHYCDHLIPSGRNPHAEKAGLGLHCWLKEKGLALTLGQSSASDDDESETSSEVLGAAFRELTLSLVAAIREGRLPRDFEYLKRMDSMAEEARRSVVRCNRRVVLIRCQRYLDPIAVYRAVDSDVVMRFRVSSSGAYHYSIGVHPRAYGTTNLNPLWERLSQQEPGWGGRANAGGSPLEHGSRIAPEALMKWLEREL